MFSGGSLPLLARSSNASSYISLKIIYQQTSLFGIFKEKPPRRRKFNSSTINVVEFYSIFFLQELDLLGYRWLPDTEFVCRLCHTLAFCNDCPNLELV